MAKDHLFAADDELSMADLADEETALTELDAIAIDRVLVGAVLVVPMSVARAASREDLAHRPITDAEPSPVALAWRVDDENPLLEEFIGVVRGRSATSSRTQKERAASGSRPVKARPPGPEAGTAQEGAPRPLRPRRTALATPDAPSRGGATVGRHIRHSSHEGVVEQDQVADDGQPRM